MPAPSRTDFARIPGQTFVRSALHQLAEGVTFANAEGRIVYSNPAADRILGVETTDARPHDWADHYGVFLPDGSAPFPTEMYPLVRALDGEECDDVEMLIRNPANPDGARISVSGRPVRDGGDEIVGAAVIFRDVTRLREAERKLWSTLTELERVQEEKEEFTEFLVHDMKSPLASILGGCELALLPENLEDEQRDTLADVHRSAKTLHRMVLNLLDIQAAESGKLDPDFKPIVLQDLLDEVAAAASGRMRESRMHFDRSGLQGQAEVLGDRELLRRVFTNLIDNCIKYGPEGGQLWLTATGESTELVRICIADEGPGVPPDLRDAIFLKYAKVERDRSRRDPSSRGLGLRFCKLAVEAHGGRIWVENNEPVGARFCVELPVAADAP